MPVTESNTCVSQKSNVTSNKIKSEKEESPFSVFHGATINDGTINVHIVTGSNKRKNIASQYQMKLFHPKSNCNETRNSRTVHAEKNSNLLLL